MSMPRWVEWLFVDRATGRVVIGQKPNLAMLIFIAATASRVAVSRGTASRSVAAPAVGAVQAATLVLWALDEALRGVNPFRRIGGAVVLAAAPYRKMLR